MDKRETTKTDFRALQAHSCRLRVSSTKSNRPGTAAFISKTNVDDNLPNSIGSQTHSCWLRPKATQQKRAQVNIWERNQTPVAKKCKISLVGFVDVLCEAHAELASNPGLFERHRLSYRLFQAPLSKRLITFCRFKFWGLCRQKGQP